MPPRPIVLSPLMFEMKQLQRSPFAHRLDIVCIGTGTAGVRRWGEGRDVGGRLVVLAGLAGAVTARFEAGTAHVVTAARGVDGTLIECARTRDWPSCVATSVDASVVDPAEKRLVQLRTGADIVDHESAAFAALGRDQEWSWAIVRGISDGVATTLPATIDGWVNGQGRLRVGRLLTDLARGRATLTQLGPLRRNSVRAMADVARRIEQLL